jgi:hypothetical protein
MCCLLGVVGGIVVMFWSIEMGIWIFVVASFACIALYLLYLVSIVIGGPILLLWEIIKTNFKK